VRARPTRSVLVAMNNAGQDFFVYRAEQVGLAQPW
jgi:hypothetical protein